MPMQTRNVYHKQGRTLSILRNSSESRSQMNHLNRSSGANITQNFCFREIYFLDSVQKIISKVTELLIAIIHCLNQLSFCALQPADGQTRV
jgi:hypothetical protein